MTMITPSYLGETIEYSSLHACRSTLEDPTRFRGSKVGHRNSFRWLRRNCYTYYVSYCKLYECPLD